MTRRLTVSIPKELKREMDKLPEVNWPQVAKAGIKKKLNQLAGLR